MLHQAGQQRRIFVKAALQLGQQRIGLRPVLLLHRFAGLLGEGRALLGDFPQLALPSPVEEDHAENGGGQDKIAPHGRTLAGAPCMAPTTANSPFSSTEA